GALNAAITPPAMAVNTGALGAPGAAMPAKAEIIVPLLSTRPIGTPSTQTASLGVTIAGAGATYAGGTPPDRSVVAFWPAINAASTAGASVRMVLGGLPW